MEDKKKMPSSTEDTSQDVKREDGNWVDDMKQELEEYIEEQGIYIRQ